MYGRWQVLVRAGAVVADSSSAVAYLTLRGGGYYPCRSALSKINSY
jgi:hypothetical protein